MGRRAIKEFRMSNVLEFLCLKPKIFAVFLAKFCDTVVVEFIIVFIKADALLDDGHSMGSLIGHDDDLQKLTNFAFQKQILLFSKAKTCSRHQQQQQQ
jgi:hypothetical protein